MQKQVFAAFTGETAGTTKLPFSLQLPSSVADAYPLRFGKLADWARLTFDDLEFAAMVHHAMEQEWPVRILNDIVAIARRACRSGKPRETFRLDRQLRFTNAVNGERHDVRFDKTSVTICRRTNGTVSVRLANARVPAGMLVPLMVWFANRLHREGVVAMVSGRGTVFVDEPAHVRRARFLSSTELELPSPSSSL